MEASRGAGAGQWPEDRGGDQGAGDGRAGWRGTCRTGGAAGCAGPCGAAVGLLDAGQGERCRGEKEGFFSSLNRNRDGVGLFHWWG